VIINNSKRSLYADYALVRQPFEKRRLYRAFSDSKRVEYTYGNNEADFGMRELEAEVCYSVDNPRMVLTFIDVREKCIVKPKIKYDYQLEVKYGSLTLLRNGVYLALQLNFNRENESIRRDFYNALRGSGEQLYSLQLPLTLKTDLRKYSIFISKNTRGSCSSSA
jgi:hypothetical protein